MMKRIAFVSALFLLALLVVSPKAQTVLAVGQACCSNPFDGRSGWSYRQDTNECSAPVGLGRETRPIECGTEEYCDSTSGKCLTEGTPPTGPTPTSDCGQIGQSCCDRGLSGAPRFYCNNGRPKMTVGQGQACTCIPAKKPAISTPSPRREEPTCDANGEKGINTAIGCIPITNTEDPIGFVLGWAIGVGGGIAFLLIVVAGFQIMTSTGNPERLKAGQELMTSAIAGLIMLIFSIFILKIIGVDILGLGQFGFGQP